MIDNTELQAVKALVSKISKEFETILLDTRIGRDAQIDRLERWAKRSLIQIAPYLIESEFEKFSSLVSDNHFRTHENPTIVGCRGYLIGLTDDLESYPEGVLKPAKRFASTSTKVKDNPD
jgi:hypothetical protein